MLVLGEAPESDDEEFQHIEVKIYDTALLLYLKHDCVANV